jgi:uncharacterized protein YqjF (DUF2071 family)
LLTAEWRHLVMLNYEMDARVLEPRVPRGTELDSWNGVTFASVVGFLFLRTKLLGVPIPFHRDFEEVNLRFYVRRTVGTEVRRGVVFIKEFVPRLAIATLARIAYNEPYSALPMRHEVVAGVAPKVEYSWQLGNRWHACSAVAAGDPALPAPGSLEEFITEHYWGYTAQRDGSTIEYRVEHPQWRVWQASSARLDADVAALYGADVAGALAGLRTSFIADGSPVTVFRPLRVGG